MKIIKGFPGYLIDRDGNVYSEKSKRFLKPYTSNRGYMEVKLYANGKSFNKYVHRLVAETFISNPEKLPEVDHINGNKLCNTVSNLRWVTGEQNRNYYYNNNQDIYYNNTAKPIYCAELNMTFSSINDAVKKLDLNRHRLKCCLAGYNKTYKGFHWKYA